ncbi:hypothetical protein [Rubrivivax albus]|uniref:Lipoprotein n=1 Tax=Rubrivivax albus TaxID=2499835 RepID=A0A3S2TQU2_9BURK|nr:hypothetical protein [Rubrivivax albus]RVT51446.1 hypothetical protein ENE75_11510 [Rubrivivax albus]
MRAPSRRSGRRLLWLLPLVVAACSPAQDWRQLQPEDSGVALQFPCKPVSHAREVTLAGMPLRLTLHACTAGDDATYALAVADVGDPAKVGAALQALLDGAAGNVGAGTPRVLPLAVRGATPNPATQRVALDGMRSDGAPVQMQVAVFTKGTRVMQATVLGRRIDADAADTFFGALATP